MAPQPAKPVQPQQAPVATKVGVHDASVKPQGHVEAPRASISKPKSVSKDTYGNSIEER